MMRGEEKNIHLKLDHVSKVFAKVERDQVTHALQDVSTELSSGEFVSLVGPSGCGKSTILRLVAGLITPTLGRVTVNGAEVNAPSPERGLVFQNPTLFPWLTVEKNISFSLDLRGDKEEKAEKVQHMLEITGLERFRNDYPAQLSGGMAQRVALVRTLINEPEILLLDEPLGALDEFTRMNIDVLCFTGHKGLMGPQGTGGLCIRPGAEIKPLLRGGTGVHSYDKDQPQAYPTRLEAGTLNSHSIAGLDAALDFLLAKSVEKISAQERLLMRRFYEAVRDIPGVTVYGDFSREERAALVALNIRDYDSSEVSDALFTDYGIATRPGAHCAPRMHEALGTVKQGAVRFSFSYYNTEAEVDAAICAVRELADDE